MIPSDGAAIRRPPPLSTASRPPAPPPQTRAAKDDVYTPPPRPSPAPAAAPTPPAPKPPTRAAKDDVYVPPPRPPPAPAAAPTPPAPAPAPASAPAPAPSRGGLFGAASNFFSGVQNAVQSTVAQVSNAASSVVHSVQNAAASAVSTVQNTAASAVQSVQNTAASAVSTVQNTAASAVQSVQNTAASTVSAAQNTAASTIHSVQNTAASVVSSVQSGAQSIHDGFVDRAAMAHDRLQSLATSAQNAAATTVNQINQGVSAFEHQVDQTAAALQPKLEQFGHDVMTTDIRDVVTVDNALKVADALNGAAPKPTLTPEQQQAVDTARWIMNAPPHELLTYDNLLSAVDAVNGDAGRPQVSPLQEGAARFTVGAALSVADTLNGFASLPQLGNTLGQSTHDWVQDMTAQGPRGDASRQAFLDSVHQFMSTPLDQHAGNAGNFLYQSFVQPVLDVKESHGPMEAAGYAVAQIADLVIGAHGADGAVDNLATQASKGAEEAFVNRAVAKVDQIVAEAASPAAANLIPPKAPSQLDNLLQSVNHAWGNTTGALGMYPDLSPLPKNMIAVTREDLLANPDLVKDLIRKYGAGTDFYVDPKYYTFEGNVTRYNDRIIHVVGGEDGLRAWGPWDPQTGLTQPGMSTTAHEVGQGSQVIFHGPSAVELPGGGTGVQLNLGMFKGDLSTTPAVPWWSASGWAPPATGVPTVAQELSQAYMQLGLPGMSP